MIGLLYRAADALRRRHYTNDHGRTGEDLAHRYLRKRGCTIVARRYRPNSGGGEIDIVAWDHGTLACIEVKARASTEFGSPAGAVDEEKQKYLAHAARDYARRANIAWENVRFDIVSIILSCPPEIEWLRNAFRPVGALKPH